MSKARLLIVHPDPSALALLTSMLTSMGHEIEEAANDRTAVRLMERGGVDLMVVGVDPSDMEALVRGITVYMIVIEGTLALTGARFILRSLKERDLMPGFRDGFTHVNRDESRHVGFGVKFLADAIKQVHQMVQPALINTSAAPADPAEARAEVTPKR